MSKKFTSFVDVVKFAAIGVFAGIVIGFCAGSLIGFISQNLAQESAEADMWVWIATMAMSVGGFFGGVFGAIVGYRK